MNYFEEIKNCDNEWEMAKLINDLASPLIMQAVLEDEIIDADNWDQALRREV